MILNLHMKKNKYTPLQILVHLAGWFPLAQMIYLFYSGGLTANPIQDLEQRSGINAITFLLYSLACTPLASIAGWREMTQRRKALGNYGFLYATVHFLMFFVVDYGLDLMAIWNDVGTKWYIILGFTAFLMLLPLAFTSFNYWQKRLGKAWKKLHKLVYFISPLVIIHFALASKADFTTLQGNVLQPVLYGGAAVLLLILRIPPLKNRLIQIRQNWQARWQAYQLKKTAT